MNTSFTLSELKIGEYAVVKTICCDKKLKNRIMDLGMVPGAEVLPVFNSPFGNPTAYLVNRSIIALRNEDCRNILVTGEAE